MKDNIFIYAVRDENSVKGFILVASEEDIDTENTSLDKVDVFHIHSDKKKPYTYLVNKKATQIKFVEFMSVVDEELYEYTPSTRILTFDKKGYDNLIGQLMDDLEEEEQNEKDNDDDEDDDSDGDDKKKNKKKNNKKNTTKSATSSEITTRQRGRPKTSQNKESENESYQEDEEEGEVEKTKGRGRPKKVKTDKVEVAEDKNDKDENDEIKKTGKRGRPSAKSKLASVSFKEDNKKMNDENEGEEEVEKENKNEESAEENDDNENQSQDEAQPKGKRGRKPAQKSNADTQKKENNAGGAKRGRKPKKISDSEENEDDDDKENENGDKNKKAAPKKGAKKQEEKFKKGSNNPNIPNVIQVDETFEGNSTEINDKCCSFCTNKELLRAVYTGNHELLQKLIDSKLKVSTLFAKRGPDSDETILEIILKNKDKKALEIIINALQNKQKLYFASNPECCLDEVETGFNDRNAYGVATRKVQASRGGKEGNNAFVADINQFVETSKWHHDQKLIFSLLENETEVQFLEFLRGLKDESLSHSLIEKSYVAVRAGNRKTAAYLMEQAFKFGGYGFNKVHEQVLSLDDPSKMEEFRRVSATKNSTGVYNNSRGYRGAQGIITPIHCAAINPNPEFIKKLLDIAPEFTIPDDLMRKPVHYAATCEGPGPLSFLLTQGVDTREGDKFKITPLMLAAQFGRAKNIEILLDANGKSNPESRTKEGMRAIHFAAQNGHIECIKLLIDKGEVKVDTPGLKRMTPLHIAASKGHYELVEYLLSKGAKVTVKDKLKRSAIIHATMNGQLKILSLLLKKGGPFNDADSSNNTPVHYAAAYGFQGCLDLLKQAGADFNPQNSWNLTPLSVSIAKGHFGMVKKLLNYPECDVNCTDVEGRTIISRATEKLDLHNIDQFEFILKEKKANPNMSDLKGQTPLHYLCNLSKYDYIRKRENEERVYTKKKQFKEGYKTIIKRATTILLDCGAEINKLNINEQSPLMICIKQKNYLILDLLLKKGGLDFGLINKIDQNIFHILSCLIKEGSSGIQRFRQLFEEIKKDKSVNIKEYINMVDHQGFTPLLLYVKTFTDTAQAYRNNKEEKIKKNMQEKSLNSYSEEARKQADKELLKFEQEFLKFITFLVSEGANINSKVQKIKKYRNKMDEELIEDQQKEQSEKGDEEGSEDDEDKDSEEEQSEDDQEEEQEESNSIEKRDVMGNIISDKTQNYTPHYSSFGEMNVFGLALNYQSLDFIKFFVDEYPQLVHNVDYLGRNLLTKFIIRNGDLSTYENINKKIFEWLISLKIDVNQRDTIQSTPLITAIYQNKFEFAKVLINHKASVNVKDIFGNTPFIMAINKIKSNNLEFVEYLLSKGACPNFLDNNGRSSLHHAVNVADKGANASFDLEKLLIKSGADVNLQDSLGRTPLHYCFTSLTEFSYNNNTYDPFETVSSLCNHPSIKIDVKDNLQKTPLHYAAQKNSTISAIYMIEKGASLDQEDINGNTPLSIAFRFQRSEITMTFIQNKADTSKMITIHEQVNPYGEEKKDDNQQGVYNRQNAYYGNRRLYKNKDTEKTVNSQDQNIINSLLSEYRLESDSYDQFMQQKLTKEKLTAQNQDKLVFNEFLQKGSLPVGKCSYFKAAITYQWQGMAYLLLIKSNYNLFNALEDAISIDLYQLCITLLNKYPDDNTVTQTNSEGQNLFHILCKRPARDANLQAKLFDILMARQVELKKLDVQNNSCLHYAYLHTQFTEKLLNLGLDCNILNKDENTPFTYALQENAESAIRYYTYSYKPNYSQKFKAKAKGFNESLIFTPLVFQFANNVQKQSIYYALLNNGSNVNETDSLDRSCLYYAIFHNSTEHARFILQQKDINTKHIDSFGKSPVHYVINPVEYGSYENTEILELLHEAKFDMNVKDKDGNTPLSQALLQDSQKMVEALKKFDVKVPNENKKLPKRAPTSIVATADFPEEEVDYEEDSKKFTDESEFDQYKEFFDQKNTDDKVQLDQYVSAAYNKKQNYVAVDENNEAYNLLMVKVDIGFGQYSKYVFYVMQIIYDANSGVYILYTRWGQMGEMGQMQHTPFPTKEGAVKEFSKIFLQKSKNEWTNRHNFQKHDQKYQLIQFEKKNDKKSFSLKPYDFENLVTKPSLLDKPIQEFIQNISSAEIFKSAYRQFALSDHYLPLTKLSKSALIEAQGILAELQDLLEEIRTLRTKLTEADNMKLLLEKEEELLKVSNRYYELIPRAISKWEPLQPLTNLNEIKNEQNLVENLLDFEAAIKIIMGSYTQLATQHPLDYNFNALSIRMKQIEVGHPEYKMIHQYISRTNKRVLDPNSKMIKNVFAIERRGEAERMKQFSDYQKKLLWHGSGVQNFLSILSFGLRINGIQAKKSGSSLGDGIYFSDLFEKASNYANNMGVGINSRFLLLCEVAVGKEYQIKNQQHLRQHQDQNYQLPKGFNSIKLVGNNCPNEKKNLILPNGAIVPIGPIIDYNNSKKSKYTEFEDQEITFNMNTYVYGGGYQSYNTSFNDLYTSYAQSEYVVFNSSQVRIRYLVEID